MYKIILSVCACIVIIIYTMALLILEKNIVDFYKYMQVPL